VIVVLGCPAARRRDGVVEPAGLSGWIAASAATAGATTQLVGRIGDDDLGDAVVLGLARAGVGHAALLRDATHATPELALEEEWPDDAAASIAADAPSAAAPAVAADGPVLDAEDVALGLRYLTDFAVLVIAEPLSVTAATAAADAAAFAGARTITIAGSSAAPAAGHDLFEPPDGDPEAFAAVIGRYAAALDRGVDPAEAFAAAMRAAGWSPAPRE
jgi:hypothetical protein